MSDDEYSVSESSGIADPHYSNGVRKFSNPHFKDRDGESSPEDSYTQLPENSEDQSLEDTADTNDYCKEVRCIEMEESSIDKNCGSLSSSTVGNEGTFSLTLDGDSSLAGQGLTTPINDISRIQAVRTSYISSFRSLKLTRSWSCRESFMTGSSSPDIGERTPSNGFEKNFPGRPEGFGRKFPLLSYDSSIRLSRNDSQSSIRSTVDELEAQSTPNGRLRIIS